MSPLHHTSLVFSSRFRSSSEPPSLTHTSFSVDRSSTIHTVFTMLQIDGTSESKPGMTSFVSSGTAPTRTDTANRTKGRKRFTSLFGLKKSNDAVVGYMTEKLEDKPMRVLSPRATDSVPSATNTPRERQRRFSFKKRQSTWKTKLESEHAPARPRTEELSPQLHIPVTDPPCPAPMRKDSVAMPNSPTKEMALHSHPVTRDDEVGNEMFATPMRGRSAVFGEK